jgi:hypothetical protein
MKANSPAKATGNLNPDAAVTDRVTVGRAGPARKVRPVRTLLVTEWASASEKKLGIEPLAWPRQPDSEPEGRGSTTVAFSVSEAAARDY